MTEIPQEEKKVELEAQLKALEDWQNKIHHELKAINGKLNFYTIILVLWIIVSVLGALLGPAFR